MAGVFSKVSGKVFIAFVRFYQYAISPFTPAACRHVPTCSEYTVHAIKMHGGGKGGLLAADRIARCHPWGTSGYDPVPKILVKKLKLKKSKLPSKKIMRYDLLKSKIFPLLAGFIMLFVIACQNREQQSAIDSLPVILVSIAPQKYFVEKITGDFARVIVLLPQGTSPHVYDPTPRTMVEIASAQLYFYNGNLGFEKALLPKIEDMYPDLKTSSLSKGLALLQNDEFHECDGEHHDHSHDHSGVDPHSWISPKNASICFLGNFNDDALLK